MLKELRVGGTWGSEWIGMGAEEQPAGGKSRAVGQTCLR